MKALQNWQRNSGCVRHIYYLVEETTPLLRALIQEGIAP